MTRTETVFDLEGGTANDITYHQAYVLGNYLVQRRDAPDGSVVAVIGELVRPLFVRMNYHGKLLSLPIEADIRLGQANPGTIEQTIWLLQKVRINRRRCRFFPFLKDFALNTSERTAAEVAPVSDLDSAAVVEAVTAAYGCEPERVVFDR